MSVFAALQFFLQDQVLLLKRCGDVREGSVGCVVGRYGRTTSERSYLVAFPEQRAAVELPAHALKLQDA